MTTTLFHQRYRILSARKRGHNYAASERYFVTMCTQGRCQWFGHIHRGRMHASVIGNIVADEWRKTAMIRQIIRLDRWVMMPDHLHGILEILPMRNDAYSVEIDRRSISTEIATLIVVARRRPGELGSIIAQFKSACTKRIHAMGETDFAWQRNYHDRIIRNDEELWRIRQYITDNPRRWTDVHASAS